MTTQTRFLVSGSLRVLRRKGILERLQERFLAFRNLGSESNAQLAPPIKRPHVVAATKLATQRKPFFVLPNDETNP